MLLLVGVPLLVLFDVPSAVIGIALIGSAIVLGGCGVLMAGAMARTMLRGEDEHPELVGFLARSRR